MKNKKCEHKNTKIVKDDLHHHKTKEECLDCGAFRWQNNKTKKWYLWVGKVDTIKEEDFM